MSRPFLLSMTLALAALCLTAPLSAQDRSAVSVAELDAAIAERPADVDVRGAIQEFLATDRGQEVADRMGVSVSDLSNRVANLDDASLNRIADDAGISQEVMAGGANTVVITTTTLIIVLLVIILLTI
jgi:CHASE3 domain sensor protein